jgi:hypothetical protein
MLAALRQPIYLLDTRRNGVGAQSSWSPREFASIIPNSLAGRITYAYLHLPCLAPSVALLDEARKNQMPWHTFRERYIEELTPDALDVGRAFVETAVAAGGMAIFLCAEADQPEFDVLPDVEQEEYYCHRFTLAKQVANRIKDACANTSIRCVHLDLVDFQTQMKSVNAYSPRSTEL